MLNKHLNTLKQSLGFIRLYLAAQHEQSGIIRQFFYKNELGKLALIETKIVHLQQALSFLVSQICSILVNWNDLSHDDRSEWKHAIRVLIDEIYVSKSILTLSDIDLSLEKLDRFYFDNATRTGNILGLIKYYPPSFSHYLGFAIDINTAGTFPIYEIVIRVSSLKMTNVNDSNALNEAVEIIGRDEAFDFKKAQGTTFLKGRLN